MLSETDDCCGPMAAAFLRDYSTRFEVVSAGRNPTQTIEPSVVTVMKECLVDLDQYVPNDAASLNIAEFDLVYECPDLPLPKTIGELRELRDFIKNEAYLFFRKL